MARTPSKQPATPAVKPVPAPVRAAPATVATSTTPPPVPARSPTTAAATVKPGTPPPATVTPPAAGKPVVPPAKPLPTTGPRAPASPTRTPPVTPPPPALSLADVKLLRDRLDAVKPGVPVAGSTPTDQLLAAMASKLEAARAEDRAKIAALESELSGFKAQNADLAAKAAGLAEHAAASSDDRDAELRDALAVTDRLLADLARTRTGGETAAAELAAAKTTIARVQREVSDLRATADPKSTGASVLGAETVAALLNDFVGSFRSQLTGLEIASGEVSLKAGFAQLGKGAGFVLPTANTPAANQPVLHEITLRLDPKGSIKG